MTTEFTHHSALSDAVTKNFEATLQTLTELVAIPSIAWESHDLTQVDRSAEAVAALATKAGFDNVRIERATYTTADGTEKQGMPAVIASRPAAEGYPTILLYAHTLMAQLIATLHDATGAVAVEGLHRAPEPELEYAEADFRNDSGILDTVPLAGTGSVASRLWTQPAISVIGMDIPSIATSSNTLAVVSRARISTRLAPGDNPENAHRALAEHIKAHAPHGAQANYTAVDSGMPFATEVDADGAQTALDAMRAAWDVEPVQTGMGGSIPFISDLKDLFPQAQILVTGVEDPDTRAHSANESLYIPDFKNAILAEALLLSALGAR